MSNGQKLLIIPNDLRDAAGLFERRSGEFEGIAELLRREWRALEVPSEYAAEAAVAAACERAFGELLRSRQICAEVARALRLTADTLEEADRRAAALIRCNQGNGRGGDILFPPPWIGIDIPYIRIDDESPVFSDWLSKLIKLIKIPLGIPIFWPGVIRLINIDGVKYIIFKPPIGSSRLWGIDDGVPLKWQDFRVKIDLKQFGPIGKVLWAIEGMMPFIRAAEGVSQHGLHLPLAFHAIDAAAFLGKVSKTGLKRLGYIAGVGVGLYEAFTDPKYADKRVSAALVKAGIPVLSNLLGAGLVKAGALLTLACPPAGAVVIGIGLITPIVLPWLIEPHEEALINALDKDVVKPAEGFVKQSFSELDNALRNTTQRLIEEVHNAGRALDEGIRFVSDLLSPARTAP